MEIPATASISPTPPLSFNLKFFSLDVGDAGGFNAYGFVFIIIRFKPYLQRTVIICFAG